MRGSLGASLVSSIAAGTGIVILVTNLKNSLVYIHFCQEAYEDDFCLAACFSTVCISCGKAKILGPNLSKKPSFPFQWTQSFFATSVTWCGLLWVHARSCWLPLPTPQPNSTRLESSALSNHLLVFPCNVSLYRDWSRGWGWVMKTGAAVRGRTLGSLTLGLYLSFWLFLVVQQEIVAMILFLTILGFGVAVLLTLYRIGELFKGKVGRGLILNPEWQAKEFELNCWNTWPRFPGTFYPENDFTKFQFFGFQFSCFKPHSTHK